MNARQQRFVEEYLIDLNATQAAIRAGYSSHTAYSQGEALLRHREVGEAIARAKAERSRRTGVTADRVVEELAKLAFANLSDVVSLADAAVLDEAKKADTAAVSSVKVRIMPTSCGVSVEREVKLHEKTRPLVELGRHVGIFDNKLKIEGPAVTVNIQAPTDNYKHLLDSLKQRKEAAAAEYEESFLN